MYCIKILLTHFFSFFILTKFNIFQDKNKNKTKQMGSFERVGGEGEGEGDAFTYLHTYLQSITGLTTGKMQNKRVDLKRKQGNKQH